MAEFLGSYATSRDRAAKARVDAQRRIKLATPEDYNPATDVSPPPAPPVQPQTSVLDAYNQWANSLYRGTPFEDPELSTKGDLTRDPSLADVISRAVSATGETLGLGDKSAQAVADKVAGPVDWLTPAGTALSADRARTAAKQGNYGEAALEGISAIPGLGHIFGGAVKVVAPSLKGAILHAIPNLFKKPALEDAARGVGADAIWKNWGWEKSRDAGWTGIQYRPDQWWTETPDTAAKLRDTLEKSLAGEPMPDRASRQLFPAGKDPAQLELPLPLQRYQEESPPLHRAPKVDELSDLRPTHLSSLHAYPQGTTEDYLQHPALFNEPGLGEIASTPMFLREQPPGGDASLAGVFHYPTPARPIGAIQVKTTAPDPLGTTIHEIGHKAQNLFDFPGGFNPKDTRAPSQGLAARNRVYQTLHDRETALNQRNKAYWKAEEDWLATNPHPDDKSFSLEKFKQQWARENPELQARIDRAYELPEGMSSIEKINAWNLPRLAYTTEGGEVAARNMTKRAKMSLKDLADTRPGLTEDVPRFLQWDNRYPKQPPKPPFKEAETPWRKPK